MSAIHRRSARLGLTAIACAAVAACSSLNGATGRIANMVTPYKIEIVQGNFVSKEQVEALQRGMTRSQVKEVLGTPLMTSLFHANRWDYVFTLKRQGVEPQQRKLALFFQGEQLDKWEGDEMPTEAEFVAQLDSGRRAVKVPLLEVPEEVLKEFNAKNPPTPKADVAAAAAAAAPAAAYPPLEAPGTVTQAWDASTQRAVAAAAAARPSAQPSAALLAGAPAASAAAAAPARAVGAPASSAAAAATTAPVAAAPAAPRPTPTPAPAPAASGTVAPVVVGSAAATAAAAPAPAAPAAGTAASTATPAAPVPAAAVAAVPAPAPAPAPAVSSGFAGMDADVAAFLNGWMNDWQARNAQAYFARYLPEFKGTSATRAEWEAQRRPRIETRSGMTLGVQDVRAVMVPPDGARIVFRQVYNSDAGSEVGTKALFLVKRDGRWLIEREFFTPAR
jgi:outer membrane protein assembly factor BamE